MRRPHPTATASLLLLLLISHYAARAELIGPKGKEDKRSEMEKMLDASLPQNSNLKWKKQVAPGQGQVKPLTEEERAELKAERLRVIESIEHKERAEVVLPGLGKLR